MNARTCIFAIDHHNGRHASVMMLQTVTHPDWADLLGAHFLAHVMSMDLLAQHDDIQCSLNPTLHLLSNMLCDC